MSILQNSNLFFLHYWSLLLLPKLYILYTVVIKDPKICMVLFVGSGQN